ncbi:hypothetical protein ETAA8_02900 [Anatilimnocola aggregata]|uniref:Uncharacterized protein n=1 Tax=Anatilimnocola aggregata TaxID=2528021 RepID=A0A517Y4R3_9BACT|nr:hypothetical protein [Anatilimnocola aggregata]QDU25227.1 hypothetical protein ETAA8_02900 [Anatilimnocola aggregata]
MPYLAKGSDEALKRVAQTEVDHAAKPLDERGIEALADQWWNLAAAKGKPPESTPYLKRAGYWYQAVVGKASGLAKAKINLRIEEINGTLKVASVSPVRPDPFAPGPSATIPTPMPMPKPKPVPLPPEPKTKTAKNRIPTPLEMETGTVCELLQGKRMPDGLWKSAIPFNAPVGDGRKGANGFAIMAGDRWKKEGTTWKFQYTWSGSAQGVEIAHPFQLGQVLIRLVPGKNGVGITAGGNWGEIGWGMTGKRKVPVEFSLESQTVFPLEKDVTYDVVSQLLVDGRYGLFINKQLMAYSVIPAAIPLDLKLPDGMAAPQSRAGSVFTGDNMPRALKAGEACLIVGPLDNGLNKASAIEFGPQPEE